MPADLRETAGAPAGVLPNWQAGLACLARSSGRDIVRISIRCIVLVSGLPRSGVSVTIQVFKAGGLPALIDDRREAGESPGQSMHAGPILSPNDRDRGSRDMLDKRLHRGPGPFRADQLRSGDPYELSDGHPVECLPSGGRHSKANLSGGLALETDPAVASAGFDTGFTPDDQNLRAPDIAVGNVPDQPGWVSGAPPLAVEYADTGQDESDLQEKIQTLLGAGARHVWVVRLAGLRRVEVYEPNKPLYLAYPGQQLEAPGILKNPVPVEALYDQDAAHDAALRNLLQRRGYADLEAVRDESREEGLGVGRSEGALALILRQLERRLGRVAEADLDRVRRLDQDGLAALAEALLDVREERDLTGWLEGWS